MWLAAIRGALDRAGDKVRGIRTGPKWRPLVTVLEGVDRVSGWRAWRSFAGRYCAGANELRKGGAAVSDAALRDRHERRSDALAPPVFKRAFAHS